ncbi:MAG: hypothetical protein M5F18_02255 [Asgard group archaeon]|nr:hypothetical protein [Asgard group archaeon]
MSYQYPTKFAPVSTNLNLFTSSFDHKNKNEQISHTNLPIHKQFNSIEFNSDPLAEILNLLRQKIKNYTLKYPEEPQIELPTDDDKENSQFMIPRLTQSTPVKQQPPQMKPVKPKTAHKVDNLACHADNILRMAIDSTIISSNSFTINSFDEEDEDDEDNHLDIHEHSLIELLKSKSSFRDLRRKRSTLRFDINADDINSVL